MYFIGLIKKKKKLLFFLLILSLFNSILYSSILMIINGEISGAHVQLGFMDAYIMQLFGVLIIISLLCRYYFQAQMISITNDIIFEFEISLLNKIRIFGCENFRWLHF